MQLLHMRTQCTGRHIPQSSHLRFPKRFDRTGSLAVFELDVGSKVSAFGVHSARITKDVFEGLKTNGGKPPKVAKGANELSCYLSLGPLSKFEFKWANRQIGISATQNGFATKIPKSTTSSGLPGSRNGWGLLLGFGLSLFKKAPEKMDKKYHGDD